MSTCPRTDRLLRLLGDDLPESEQTELVAHLDTCPDCRGALDGLAARSGLWHDLSLLRDDPLAPPTPDWSKCPEAQPQDDADIPLGLLEPPDEPGHLGKLGPYDVLRLIGRGGMGIVFLARDRALDRLVAIKLLTPGMAATGGAAAVRTRGQGRGRRGPRARRHDPRRGHLAPGRPLPGDAVHRRQVGPGTDRPGQGPRARRDPPHRQPGRRRPGRCPRPGADPPRHQARQHPAGERRRAGQDHRLRTGPRGGRRHDDPVGRGGRDAAVHVARAGRRRGDRSPDRSVQPG